MCGFAGFLIGVASSPVASWDDVLRRMGNAIAHRGPDDSGLWTDPNTGVGMVHRRLAILDLSHAGHQPMVSASGRYVVVFNGEIYNHRELREEVQDLGLKSGHWRGHSDTETLSSCIDVWGVESTLKKAVGMFAIALWDRAEKALYLARDRMGEKPLYYGWQRRGFLFGSELKALKVHPSFEGEIDRDVLTLFLRHNYVPAPYSIYRGIRKLLPGTWLRVEAGARGTGISSSERSDIPRPYWSLNDVVTAGLADPFTGSDAEATEALDGLLRAAVRQQMVADVPLGAFLSGGVDSSTVVALMQAQSDRTVRTFTIGFNEVGYNEAIHAKAVARHLGTEHTELYVSHQDAMAVIPRLPILYDEPFSDSSQIPTVLVSEMTRQNVTVSLSGDAGDELFCGYSRYLLARSIWDKLRRVPGFGRRLVARSIRSVPIEAWDRMGEAVGPILPRRFRERPVGDRAYNLAEIVAASRPEELYRNLVSHWKYPSKVVLGSSELPTVLTDSSGWPEIPDTESRMMYLDARSYLPDDILVKVDRAAMSVSLETRVPFLDHRVVEFAWRLPLAMKVRGGESKWILRQVLHKYVPRELIDRPKTGFAVPLGQWLRGPLREWAEDLLADKRLKDDGFFDPAPIRQRWSEHTSGRRNWHYYLWDVLMFQAWLREQSARVEAPR